MAKGGKRRQVYVFCTETQWRAFRVKVVKEGSTIQDVLTRLIVNYVKAPRRVQDE